MGLVDRKMLLRDLEAKLGDYIPANSIQQILETTDTVLIDYEITCNHADSYAIESADLLKYFLDAEQVDGLKASTLEHYENVLNRMLKDIQVPFSRMTVYHIRTYSRSESERGISLSTLASNRYVYSSFFGWLTEEGLIKENPVRNLPPVKTPKYLKLPYSDVELIKIKEAATKLRDRAIIEFLHATGCRIGETCALNRDDIDFAGMKVVVFGKGSKERTVFLNDVAVLFLQRYFDSRTDTNPALFIGRGKKRLKPEHVRLALKKIEAACGVPNVHPHRFRRTLATELIKKGMPIQEVQKILGHEKIETTMRYVYIDERTVANSYRKYM